MTGDLSLVGERRFGEILDRYRQSFFFYNYRPTYKMLNFPFSSAITLTFMGPKFSAFLTNFLNIFGDMAYRLRVQLQEFG
jgi:hypothetical protein